MIFVLLGLALSVMKYAEFGPVAAWSWWLVLAPFALAVVWWWYADASGLTKRREVDRIEQRKTNRRRATMEGLGLDYRAMDKNQRRAAASDAARQRKSNKIIDK